jgi:hypothetical protein
MEGYDVISDSYSTEMLIVLIAERIWSKYSSWMDDRHRKIDKQKEDERLDQIAERLSEIKGKQEGFQDMFKKMK